MRTLGGIAQRFPELINRCIEAVVEVNEGVGRPDLRPDFFSADDFSRPRQQDFKNKKWLLL
jgi:hypothetical protein